MGYLHFFCILILFAQRVYGVYAYKAQVLSANQADEAHMHESIIVS